MKNSFPKIFEIAAAAGTALNSVRALPREMWEVQEQLRSDYDRLTLAGGVVLPFYSQPEHTGREARDMTASGGSGGSEGGMSVGTAVPELGAALRANLVVELLGGRVLGGLRENVSLPRAAGLLSTEWLSETAAAAETTEEFAKLDLSPKRVTAWIEVSDQLILQGAAAESFLRTELMATLAAEIDRVAIVGSGTGGEPRGILNTSGIGSVVGGSDGLAPTLAHCCDLEYAVTGTAKADRGHLGWAVSPLVRKKLRQTALFASGSVPIWSQTEAAALLGHAAGVTPSVPDTLTKGSASGVCSALVFAEWSEYLLGFWGPGIVVNATRDRSLSIAGKVLLHATAYVDGGARTPAAFAAMLDALCS